MVTLRTHDIMIFRGINGKLLQKIYFLENAKETCQSNNRDLNCDRIIEILQQNNSKMTVRTFF